MFYGFNFHITDPLYQTTFTSQLSNTSSFSTVQNPAYDTGTIYYDTDKNENNKKDYWEPFLLMDTLPQFFVDEPDNNNNNIPDKYEVTSGAYYPYKVNRLGYHGYLGYNINPFKIITGIFYNSSIIETNFEKNIYVDVILDDKFKNLKYNIKYKFKRINDNLKNEAGFGTKTLVSDSLEFLDSYVNKMRIKLDFDYKKIIFFNIYNKSEINFQSTNNITIKTGNFLKAYYNLKLLDDLMIISMVKIFNELNINNYKDNVRNLDYFVKFFGIKLKYLLSKSLYFAPAFSMIKYNDYISPSSNYFLLNFVFSIIGSEL